jgi:hypothetical protein
MKLQFGIMMDDNLQQDYFNKIKYLFVLLRARISNESWIEKEYMQLARLNDFEGFLKLAKLRGVSSILDEQKLQGWVPLFFHNEVFNVSVFEVQNVIEFIDSLPPPPKIKKPDLMPSAWLTEELLDEYIEKNRHLFEN